MRRMTGSGGRIGPPPQKSWKSIVRWPIFLLANLALLLVIGVSTVRETYRGWTVDHEINALEAQAASLEGRKTELDILAKDLVSPDRVEYDARARLGRQKLGERVIVLEGMAPTTTSWTTSASLGDDRGAANSFDSRSNPQKWWAYFFHST